MSEPTSLEHIPPASATSAVRAGIGSDTQYGAVVPPLHLSTNFTFDGYGNKRAYDYTRSGNPTRDQLGEALAELEHGVGGVVTASGMAAVAVTLELAPAGGLIVAPHDCYGGTWRILDAYHRRGRWDVAFIDFSDETALRAALDRRPALVLLETPSNPLLRITDIAAVTAAAKKVGALTVVDNTFLSPVLQQPLELGADVVVHSTTKYINGHSDVVGGVVIARDPQVHADLKWWANCLGVTGAPFDSYLTLRGLRTLAPRIRTHQENAAAVVDLLCAHPAVERIYWPGLPEHPGHDIAVRQQAGFGAMVSFEVRGDETNVAALLSNLKYFSLAESLGGVESLVAHPASMTHAAMTPEARRTAGISGTLLRLSVGIEEPADLCADLAAGLDAALTHGEAVAKAGVGEGDRISVGS